MSGGWRDAAACKGRADLFFAPEQERETARAKREALAKAICAGCDVAGPCLEAGMATRWGTWGGLAEDERANLKRRLRRAAREAAA